MAVKPSDITNPEQQTRLQTREVKGSDLETRTDDALAEFDAMKSRVAAARTLEPKPGEAHCRDCFNRGRNAAIRAIAGE